MPYTVAAKNLMLNELRRAISHGSLHSGKPEAANEIRGGNYVRVHVEINEASHGALSVKGTPTFAVPEGAIVTHAGFWTAAKGGVLLAFGQVKRAVYEKHGVYIIDSAKLDLNLDVTSGVPT